VRGRGQGEGADQARGGTTIIDTIEIRGGTLIDGTGGPPMADDLLPRPVVEEERDRSVRFSRAGSDLPGP
jgi:hypothetical protein